VRRMDDGSIGDSHHVCQQAQHIVDRFRRDIAGGDLVGHGQLRVHECVQTTEAERRTGRPGAIAKEKLSKCRRRRRRKAVSLRPAGPWVCVAVSRPVARVSFADDRHRRPNLASLHSRRSHGGWGTGRARTSPVIVRPSVAAHPSVPCMVQTTQKGRSLGQDFSEPELICSWLNKKFEK
jgi:hypothetical protein